MSILIKDYTDSPVHQPRPLQVILVAIAHAAIREALLQAITDEARYLIHAVSSSPEALEAARDCIPDLLILDYYLPSGGGLALSDQLHTSRHMRHVPTIILSDQRSDEVREIGRRGLLSLGRPFELNDLLALLDQTLPTPSPR